MVVGVWVGKGWVLCVGGEVKHVPITWLKEVADLQCG